MVKGRIFLAFFLLWLAKWYAVLNGNVEIIKFLFEDVDEKKEQENGQHIFNEWKMKNRAASVGGKGGDAKW